MLAMNLPCQCPASPALRAPLATVHRTARRGFAASLLCGFTCLLLASGVHALSPDIRFHQFESTVWSIRDGLPQVTVQAVAQGPEGYMWTGTQAGLSRFDGTRFDVFDPTRHPAIPTRNIQALFLDSRGRLWIGTTRGPIFSRMTASTGLIPPPPAVSTFTISPRPTMAGCWLRPTVVSGGRARGSWNRSHWGPRDHCAPYSIMREKPSRAAAA